MKLLAIKSTTIICKRVASNVDEIPFQRKFQELLLLQGEVAHQKHHPLFLATSCFLVRWRLRLLNFSLVWFIPTTQDFMTISTLQNWHTFFNSSLHCKKKNWTGYLLIKNSFKIFLPYLFCFFKKNKF